MRVVLNRTGLLGAAVCLGLLLPLTMAHAEIAACRRAIVNRGAKFVQAKTKALSKCEVARIAGVLPAATDCHTEPKAVAAITKSAAKLGAVISTACGGVDDLCGGDGTGEDDATAIGFGGTCPNFENGVCDDVLGGTTCEGVADCLICVDESRSTRRSASTRES